VSVSWTDDDTRRHLHRLFAVLGVLAVVGHFLPGIV
jgi:hypothetical protein